jgi:hypothetical protein
MARGQRTGSIAFLLFAVACGGSKPPAGVPSVAPPPTVTSETTATSSAAPPEPDDAPKSAAESAPQEEDDPEPVFTPDMSVDAAINAIPQSAQRVNVDQETMSKPLEDAFYEPCKPGAAHFTLRIAVWRGKAVAIDLTTTPKNPKLAECLKGRIHDLTWSAKVPSLNTVEYSM